MTRKRLGKVEVLLTARAVRDVADIEEYSAQRWGETVAERYLSDIEAALQRLKENPDLLREEPEFHRALRFHRVNKHLLVCDVVEHAIFVLTLIHASMDIPHRLSELQPTLSAEAEMLHRQLQQRRKPPR